MSFCEHCAGQRFARAQGLRMLVGSDDAAAAIPEQIDAKGFAEQVLGFQDYAAPA